MQSDRITEGNHMEHQQKQTPVLVSSHTENIRESQNSGATSANAIVLQTDLVVHNIANGTAMSSYTKEVELEVHDIVTTEPQQNQAKDSSYHNSFVGLNAVYVEVIEEIETSCANSDETIADFKKRNGKKKKKKNNPLLEDGAVILC